MNRTTRFAILALATLGAGTVWGGDIYRYTDADGNVHYGDRPTGVPSEELVAISSKPTNPAAVQARLDARRNTAASAEEATSEEPADAERPTRAERAAAAKERADKCQQYRDQLEIYVTSRRLYRETEDGEREYLDENEVLDARTKAEESVREFCE
jgi:hypothetical protein